LSSLQVPHAAKLPRGYLWRNWVRGYNKGRLEEPSGGQGAPGGQGAWTKAKKGPRSKGKAPQQATAAATAAAAALGGASTSGGAGSSSSSSSQDPLQDIWEMPRRQRQEYTRAWREQLREQWAEELDELLQRVQRLQQEARSLEQGAWEALIGSARVVGCTTTGAALHKQLLQGSNAPRVVMVEEAAEILEAHVLTSLSPRTRHLVMIGDHKQLRPKVECYELSVQVSGRLSGREAEAGVVGHSGCNRSFVCHSWPYVSVSWCVHVHFALYAGLLVCGAAKPTCSNAHGLHQQHRAGKMCTPLPCASESCKNHASRSYLCCGTCWHLVSWQLASVATVFLRHGNIAWVESSVDMPCAFSHTLTAHGTDPLRSNINVLPIVPLQARKGHELNVSLFERLVLAGYPHASLAVQHRMHPEVSALIKHTYPALKDHPKVAAHPPVKGLGSKLVFIDHRHPELQEENGSKAVWGSGVLGTETQSKINRHEVGMSVAVVRFLLQQGYAAGQLVVLTPYLGQLQELNHELSRQNLQVRGKQRMQHICRAAVAWACSR
jgi:hypothetical protein